MQLLLRAELEPFDEMMLIITTDPIKMPRITEYLTVAKAEELLRMQGLLEYPERVYDEKFGLLQAPSLFLPDLRYFRTKCDLRDRPVSVAFLDIDNFKSYNKDYTYEVVDRAILPPLMSEIESHVFARGHAYRYAGDEYALILPNMSQRESQDFVKVLQRRMQDIDYPGVPEAKPTVSVGTVEIEPDGMVTDREALEQAQTASVMAKENGRDRIVAQKSTVRPLTVD